MRVQEIMTRDVVAVGPDTPVAEIARLLVEHRIGSVPVLDTDGRPLGVVSEDDLFLKERGIPYATMRFPSLFREWVDPARLAEIYAAAQWHTAVDVLSHAIVAAPGDDVGHVAWLMAQRRQQRALVVENGRLAGIVTRGDIIRMLARAANRFPD